VENPDWTIYSEHVKSDGSKEYVLVPVNVNVDESKCAQHPSGGGRSCPGSPTPKPAPPTPAPPPKPYEVAGTIDVGTLENSIFSWKGTLPD